MTFAPGAVAFAMAYTDSLFLLLAAGALLAAEQRRSWLMALLYGLATLTRLPGILLAIPLAIVIVQQAGTWRTKQLWWLLAGPLAFAAFAAYLGATFGEPLGMLTAQQAWSDIGRPEAGNATPVLDRFDPIVLLLVGSLCMYVFLFVFFRRDRLAMAHAAYAVLAVVTALASGRLQSFPRYVAVAWPYSWVLANRQTRWLEYVGLAGFAGTFVVFAVLHFTQALAP